MTSSGRETQDDDGASGGTAAESTAAAGGGDAKVRAKQSAVIFGAITLILVGCGANNFFLEMMIQCVWRRACAPCLLGAG